MQAYTHLIFGALCVRAGGLKSRAAATAAFAVAALSHPILDISSQVTFHPVDGSVRDTAWVLYHSVAYALAISFAIRFRQAWLVMLAALWPDLDWVLRPLHVGWPEGTLHKVAFALPGMQTFQTFVATHLPDWRASWVAGLPELAVSITVAMLLILLERRQLQPSVLLPQPQLAHTARRTTN
jgi:hypothetical protein